MKLFSKDSGVPISLLLTVGAFSVIVKLHRRIVSSFSVTCMAMEMLSRSLRISWRFFVPRMFLKDVWARSLNNKIVLQLVCSVCTINTIYTNNSRVRWSVLKLPTFYLGLQYVKWVLKTIGLNLQAGAESVKVDIKFTALFREDRNQVLSWFPVQLCNLGNVERSL